MDLTLTHTENPDRHRDPTCTSKVEQNESKHSRPTSVRVRVRVRVTVRVPVRVTVRVPVRVKIRIRVRVKVRVRFGCV